MEESIEEHERNERRRDSAWRRRHALAPFLHRVLTAAVVVVLALFLWKIHTAILLAFAGVLLAVFLRGLARTLSHHTPLSTQWALLVVGILIIGLFVLGGWLLGPSIADQFARLTETIPRSLSDLRGHLQQYSWGQYMLQNMSSPEELFSGEQNRLSQLTGFASMVLNFFFSAVLILFVGIFLSIRPGLYVDGIARLFPGKRRDRAREVMNELGDTLWYWLLGRFVAILFVFAATALGLWLLGVPLALVLGFIAGILDFVPWVGPILALLPAMLLAFTMSPTTGLYVILLYLVVQQLEGNLVTPLVQRRAVMLPEALVILALTAFGLLFGILGVFLATPLAAAALVLVKMLYIEDVLGDKTKLPAEHHSE